MERQAVYVCSCVPDGGIRRFDLLPDGSLQPRDAWQADRPSFAVKHGSVLYAALRAPFPGSPDSGLAALRIGADGVLAPLGGLKALGGEGACHLAVCPSGAFLYTANYHSGSVSQLPLGTDGEPGDLSRLIRHRGSGPHPKRQAGPHAHCTVFTPDGKYLCVVDLGLDRILLYAVDGADGIRPEPFSRCAMDPGVGPRHIVFSRDGRLAFSANELRSSVTVLRFDGGRLEPAATYATLPASFSGESYCAAVRLSPCGRRLYVSNRGHDSLASFAVEGDSFRLIDITGCGGKWPRDFDLSPDGGLLVCANERSHDVVTFRVDRETGAIAPTGFRQPLPSPLCVTFA